MIAQALRHQINRQLVQIGSGRADDRSQRSPGPIARGMTRPKDTESRYPARGRQMTKAGIIAHKSMTVTQRGDRLR